MPLTEVLDCIDHWIENGADQGELDAVARERKELAEPLFRLADAVLGRGIQVPELSETDFPLGYRHCREIGRGGFARVFLAEDVALDREVAVKCLTEAGRLQDAESPKRILREARIQSLCSHANIAGLYAIDTFRGHLFLVIEYVPGETLRKYLARTGPLQPVAAAALLVQIAAAAGYLHTLREPVIHRDLTPNNVMVVTGTPAVEGAIPTIKLIDFGLGKPLAPDATKLTAHAAAIGTPAYMAPEQFAPAGPQDARTDVFALGAILFEMLVGRPIRSSPPERKAGERQAGANPPVVPPSTHPTYIPLPADRPVAVDLKKICEACLRREPDERFYEDATDLQSDLELFLRGEPPKVRAVTRWVERWYWVKRNRTLAQAAAVAAAAVLVGIAAGVVAIYQRYEAVAARAGEADAIQGRLTAEVGRSEANRRRAEEAQTVATRALVAEGMRTLRPDALFAAGDPFASLLFLAKAAEMDGGHQTRGAIHRTRLAALAGQLPELGGLLAFDGPPDAAVLSPDGRRLAAFAGGRGRVWDVATGEPVGADFPARGGAFTPDGARLVRFGEVVDSIDCATGRSVTPRVATERPITLAAVSRDGKRVAIVEKPNRVSVWNVGTGKLENRLANVPPAVDSLAFSPDPGGRYLVVGRSEHLHEEKFGLWKADAAARIDLGGPTRDRADVRQLAFSPDGEWFATVSRATLSDPNTFRLWSVADMVPTELDRLSLPPTVDQAEVTGLALSPGRRRIAVATGPSSRKVVLFDPLSPEHMENHFDLEASETTLANPFVGCSFSDSGNELLAVTARGQPIFWETVSGTRLTPAFPAAASLNRSRVCASLSSRAPVFATVADDGVARVWTLRTTPFQFGLLEHPDAIVAAEFTRDGLGVVSGSATGQVFRWDLQHRAVKGRADGHVGPVFALACAADGRLFTAGDDARIRVWTPDLRPTDRVFQHDGPVHHLDLTPDGSLVLGQCFGLRDRSGWSLTVWRSDDGVKLWSKRGAEPLAEVAAASFSPDGRRVLLATRSVAVFDAASGEPQGPPVAHPRRVRQAAWSADGERVATAGTDAVARLWAAADPANVLVLPHQSSVEKVAFAPGGGTLVTGEETVKGNVIREWDAADGQAKTRPVRIGESQMSGLAFSADGTWLAVGGGERGPTRATRRGVVTVLDASTLQTVAFPILRPAWVTSPRFSPDGRRLLWMSRDVGANSVSLFDLAEDGWPVETRTAWAEAVSGRRLDGSLSLVPLPPAEVKSLWRRVTRAK